MVPRTGSDGLNPMLSTSVERLDQQLSKGLYRSDLILGTHPD